MANGMAKKIAPAPNGRKLEPPEVGAMLSSVEKSALPVTTAPMPNSATMASAAIDTTSAKRNEVSAPSQLTTTKIAYRPSHHTHCSPASSSENPVRSVRIASA